MDISVLITVYNGERYIKDAIESVLQQEKIDVEIIIINDGSTDNTDQILASYESYENIIIIKSKRIGRGKALNLALNTSSGKYVAILDADDLYHPHKLKSQYQLMENDSNLGVVATGYHLITKDFSIEEIEITDKKELDTPQLSDVTEKIAYHSPLCHSSVVMKKSILVEVGGYDETRARQYDYDLWIRIVNKGWRLFLLDKSLTYKRIHNKQSFENKDRIKHLGSSIELQKRAIRVLNLSRIRYLNCYARFLYGLMPRKLRMFIRGNL